MMMRLSLIFVVSLIVSTIYSLGSKAVAGGPNSLGMSLPEITLTKMDGTTTDLSGLVSKKPVYIKFWATWCVPCIQQMPHFQSAYEQYGDTVDFLAINIGMNNDEDDINRFLYRRPFDIPIVIDKSGLAARALGVSGTPFHVLIDASGAIVHTGHEADETVDNFLAGISAGETFEAKGLVDQSSNRELTVDFVGGDSVSLKELLETGPVALAFSATWCEWYWEDKVPEYAEACEKQRLTLDKLQQEYDGKVQTISLMSHFYTSATEVNDYIKRHAAEYPIAIDQKGDIARHFDVTELPTIILLDKGTVSFKASEIPASFQTVVNDLVH